MTDFMAGLGIMSLQASFMIAVVVLVRKTFFQIHIPTKYSMSLWFLIFFFLVFPWRITSPIGFWKDAPTNYEIDNTENNVALQQGKAGTLEISGKEKEKSEQKVSDTAYTENSVRTERKAAEGNYRVQEKLEDGGQGKRVISMLCVIWGLGLTLLLFYSGISYWKLNRKVLCSIRKEENIYVADGIAVPMVMGIFCPKIYIPTGIAEKHLEYVIAHEKIHIRRKDFLTKLLAYLITCVHWFNPLVWLAHYLMAKDMEMACDEETIKRMGVEKKSEYAKALLQLSVKEKRILVAPLAFGEGDIKPRIKNVLAYKNPVKILAVMGVLVVISLAAVFISKGEEAPAVNQEKIRKNAETVIKKEAEQKPETEEEQNAENFGQEKGTKELTFETVREAFIKKGIRELNFLEYSNGEKNLLGEDALNYNVDFHFSYDKEEYCLHVSYDKETDQLEDISISRLSDSEYACLYTTHVKQKKVGYPKEKYSNGSSGLEDFLQTKPRVEDWLNIKLPKAYTLGSYQGDGTLGGGALISPQVYDVKGEEEDSLVPEEWLYAGYIGRIQNAKENFSFKNGKLQKDTFPHYNHSTVEEVERMDGLDWPAILVHYHHEIYAGGQSDRLEEEGTGPTDTSDYWYFFFAKEEEDLAYYLTLASKEFSKKEAIAIAKTVKIKERKSGK